MICVFVSIPLFQVLKFFYCNFRCVHCVKVVTLEYSTGLFLLCYF